MACPEQPWQRRKREETARRAAAEKQAAKAAAEAAEREQASRFAPAKFWRRSLEVVGLLAAVAGIFSAVPWLLEIDDRNQERLVRRATLIDSAFSAIDSLTADKTRPLLLTPRLQWALNTLSQHKETVLIDHPDIAFQGGNLACVDLQLRGNIVQLLHMGVETSSIAIESKETFLEDIQAVKSFMVVGPPVDRKTEAAFVSPPIDDKPTVAFMSFRGDLDRSFLIADDDDLIQVNAIDSYLVLPERAVGIELKRLDLNGSRWIKKRPPQTQEEADAYFGADGSFLEPGDADGARWPTLSPDLQPICPDLICAQESAGPLPDPLKLTKCDPPAELRRMWGQMYFADLDIPGIPPGE